MRKKHEKAEAIGAGELRGGKIAWDDQAGFTRELRQMADGVVVVSVEHASRAAIRSLQANKYLWSGVFKRIAEATGQPIDDVHDFYCDRFLKRKVFMVNRQTGEVDEREVARGTSKLSPDDFWAFVDDVRLHAVEWHCLTIPDPDPRWKEKAERRAA